MCILRLLKVVFILAFLGAMPAPGTASAAAISVVSGAPLAKAASGALRSQSLTIVQIGQDIWADASKEAWTWDYAFVPLPYIPPLSKTKNDTTLNLLDGNNDPNVAHAIADKSGWFGREAVAEGTAAKQTGAIDVRGEAKKFSVAKAFAGVGGNVETAGAGMLATIGAKLIEIVLDPAPLDPPIEALLPGSDVLDKLDGTTASGVMPFPIASFLYEIEITPPVTANESPWILYSATGTLGADPATGGLDLVVSDQLCARKNDGSHPCAPGNLLTRDDFGDLIASDGVTKIGFKLKSEKDLAIPLNLGSTTWTAFGITATGGVYAAASDTDPLVPEPGTPALLGVASAGLCIWRRRFR